MKKDVGHTYYWGRNIIACPLAQNAEKLNFFPHIRISNKKKESKVRKLAKLEDDWSIQI